jgi:hypothetical protein
VKVPAGVLWHPVTDGNCVAVRRGGEQPEVNDQSVTQVNSIRQVVVASLLGNGEAQMTHGPSSRATIAIWSGKPGTGNPRVVPGRRQVVGDGMIGRFDDKTQGDPDAFQAGVHAPSGTEGPGVQESEHP